MNRAGTVVVASVLLALVVGCRGAVAPAPAPWERPGLAGAVRPEMGSPQPGELAPDLTLPDLQGASVSLASMRGSWVVLHFTASWCPFCDSEVEHLGALAQALAPRGVKIVLVDVEEDVRAWHDYAAARVPSSVVALHDASGAAAARFAPPRAQPSFEDRAQVVLDATLVVDPTGVVRLFLLPDSAHFDPTFRAVREQLDELVPRPAVSVSVAPGGVSASAGGALVVRLDVAPGFHIMSDRPSSPSYVATRVVVEGAPGVHPGQPVYPAASSFALADRTIATFAGSVEVRVPLDVAPDGPSGPRQLHGTVRYQACTASRCLFPVSRPFEVTVDGPPRSLLEGTP